MISDALVSHIKQSTSEQLPAPSDSAQCKDTTFPTPIHVSTSCPSLMVVECFSLDCPSLTHRLSQSADLTLVMQRATSYQ